jgi:hypothetical protein
MNIPIPPVISGSGNFHDMLIDKLEAISGGGGNPSLPLNSIQFNNAGAFGGASTLLADPTGSTPPAPLNFLTSNGQITLGSPSINPTTCGIIRGAAGTISGDSGSNMILCGGNSLDASAGNIALIGGMSGGDAGSVFLYGGISTGTNPGSVNINGGSSSTSGGSCIVSGGSANNLAGDGGSTLIIGGNASSTGAGGHVTLTAGDGNNGGNVVLTTGLANGGTSGSLLFNIGGASATQYIWPTSAPTPGQNLQAVSVIGTNPTIVTLVWV